jgi:hypothetical protein
MHSSMSGSRSLSAAGKLTVAVWSLRPPGSRSRSPWRCVPHGPPGLVILLGSAVWSPWQVSVCGLLAWDAAAPGIGHGVAEGPELLLLDEPTNGAQQFCGRAAQGWQAARDVAGRRRVAGAQLGVRLPVPHLLPRRAHRPRRWLAVAMWGWPGSFSGSWSAAPPWPRPGPGVDAGGREPPRCWRRSSCCNASCPAPTRARWRQRSGCRTREHGQHPGHHDHRRWDPGPLVLAAYLVAFTVVAAVLLQRRDVT